MNPSLTFTIKCHGMFLPIEFNGINVLWKINWPDLQIPDQHLGSGPFFFSNTIKRVEMSQRTSPLPPNLPAPCP